MARFCKKTQLMQQFIKGPFLSLLFLYCINDLPDDVISNNAIYAVDTVMYSKCDQVTNFWQQLELGSDLESSLGTL